MTISRRYATRGLSAAFHARLAIKVWKVVLDQMACFLSIEGTAIVLETSAFRSYCIEAEDDDGEDVENDQCTDLAIGKIL